MSTLITGVGLVGTAFAQRALQRGEKIVFFDMAPKMDFLQRKLGNADVTVLKRDIRDLPALIDAMQTHKVDTVLHTAGLIGGAVANPVYSGLQINVMGTVNVAEAVRLTGVKRLIQISTMGVYNRRMEGDDPIEEGFYRGDGNAYGNSKVAKELMVEAYQRLYGFELVVLRLANVFGFGHFAGGSAGGEMLQNLVEAGVKGGVANIPQESTRDFEYVYFKDVGRAIELAATIPAPAETTFNIGTGDRHHLRRSGGHGPGTAAETGGGNPPRQAAALLEAAHGHHPGQGNARVGTRVQRRGRIQGLYRGHEVGPVFLTRPPATDRTP